MARVSQQSPDFSAMAVMPDGSFKQLTLSKDYAGKKVLLFFYPLDFTFVCPSEIIAFDRAIEQFKTRGVEVVGCSVDSHFSHYAWRETPIEKGGIGKVRFPILADLTKKIATDYGVMHPMGAALRGLFIMDAKHKLSHALVNDLPIGRSVEEAIRVIDAMEFHEKNGEACPANWKKGEKGMKETAEGVATYLASMK